MNSQRKPIREAVGTLLKAGVPTVSNRVYESRVKRLWAEELPAILVYTKSETAEIFSQAPREYRRTLKLVCEVVAKLDDTLDDTLDEICASIETTLFRNETLSGLVSDVLLSDTEIDFVPDAEQPIGAARVTFDVLYFTASPDEQPGLAAFTKAHIEMTPEGATDATQPAVDDLQLPQ